MSAIESPNPIEGGIEGSAAGSKERLNPRLIQRSKANPPPTYKDKYTGELRPHPAPDSDDEDPLTGLKVRNPRLDMLHTGKWIHKAFELGRYVPRTGSWNCCGHEDHLSMYCDSKLARKIWQEGIANEEAEEAVRLRYKKSQEKRIKGPWDRKEIGLIHPRPESQAEQAMKEANVEESRYNAPMLVSWIYKHLDEELTTTQGLNYMLKQVETGEGCELMLKNSAVDCVMAAAEAWRTRPDLTLMCASIIRKLLDCNFTRPALLGDIALLRKSFGFGHTFMSSIAHVEEACNCVMQFARSDSGRADIMGRQLPVYMTGFVKRYSRAPAVVRPVLKTFNWVTDTRERMKQVCDWDAVRTCIKCMQRHNNDARVLAPGMHFLTRAVKSYEPAAGVLLNCGAVSTVIHAMKVLYSNDVLQIEGLKMLQMLSKTKEGWKQISDTRGGWQSITQGVTLGNALIHDLPGDFNNPGWAIGDTPHLHMLDRLKQEAAALDASRKTEPGRSDWTAMGLKGFMGLPTKEMKLAVNNERHECFFSLLTTLGLLPKPGEEREYWFIRIKAWEKDQDANLDEMTETLLRLRKKAVKDDEEPEGEKEYVKPVYFNGSLYNSQELVDMDMDIMDDLGNVVDA